MLEATAKEITASTGHEVIPVQLDIRDPAAVSAALDACEEKAGVPDIVINNAAGNFVSPTERLSPNAFKTVLEIVLNGTAYVTLDAGKRMIKAKKGESVFIGLFLHQYKPAL